MNIKLRLATALLCAQPLLCQATPVSKTETIEYHDDTSLWVMGQVARTTTDGIETSRTDYGWKALPWKVYAFGLLQQTLAYDQTSSVASGQLGTLYSIADGGNKVTKLEDWHRGVPRLITFPDTYTIKATVNDLGWITSVTDQNGYTTGYDYDLMGRIKTVTPPVGDVVAWLPTSITFATASNTEFGLPSGRWRRTETRGTYTKVTDFDAMWRPLVEREFDAAEDGDGTEPNPTQRIRGWQYDHDGRVTFELYPVASLGSYLTFADTALGVRTEYDALGRTDRVTQHSELGPLVTDFKYEPGFQTHVTNARLQTTISSFQAFDTPDTSKPVLIKAPEGATTTIVRDIFGKPKSITRSGDYEGTAQSVTRSYVYDAYQRLCKMIEPETGSTVMDYDAAGNLLWSASGLALPSTTQCDRTHSLVAAAKVQRTYDNLNRLATLRFPGDKDQLPGDIGDLGDQDWSYYADGVVKQITTYNADGATVVNDYTYNTLRLLRTETMTQSGRAGRTLTLDYTPNAHLKSVTHPSLLVVDYAPNALGQAKQAINATTGQPFASLISYYPNGGMAQFTYGNGLIHTMSRNVRGLPERSQDASLSTGEVVLDDTYDYDHNGNVAAITDALPGNRGNRTMQYDGLDRLTQIVSPMFGTASYRYDALDNLRTLGVSAGAKSRNYTYVYDPKQRLERVQDSLSAATVHSYGYDVQGNLSSKDGQSFLFDYGNRLRDVVGVERYRYDGHGRRVRSEHATQGTIYSLYGQDGVLRNQRDERTGKDTDYVYLSGSLIAQVTTPIAPPVVTTTISIGDASITEGNSGTKTISLPVTLSQATTVDVSFSYATADGSASSSSDYVAKSGSGSIAAGLSSTTLSFTVNGDTAVEADEYFLVNLSNVINATVTDGQGKATIQNDDVVVPNIYIDDSSVQEGNSGSTAAYLTVRLSQATTVPVSFKYSTANGTASSASDYVAKSLVSGTIEAGSTSTAVSVVVNGDTTEESDETLTVSLSSVVGATVGDSQATLTIENDDTRIFIDDASVTEGNSGTKSASLTVRLSKAIAVPVTFKYSTANGTASSASDYVAKSLASGTVAPGSTSATVSVVINGDTTEESHETLTVSLSNIAVATTGDSLATLTIENDDTRIFIDDASVTEGNSGTKNASLTVRLSQAVAVPVTFKYSTANGTALSGSDYVAKSLVSGSIEAGSTSTTVSVVAYGDTTVEPDETLTVSLSNIVGTTVGDGQATLTIANDDVTMPTIYIDDVSEFEGNSGTKTVNLTARLSQATTVPVTFKYSTANGTATSGSDYVAKSLVSGNIPAGSTSTTVSVVVNGDTTIEPNETLTVSLSSIVGATVGDSQATLTILNDELPNMTITGASIVEGNSGSKTVNLTVSLSSPPTLNVTFKYWTVNGSALSGSDYAGKSQTLVYMPAGTTSVVVPITIYGDTAVEPNETFTVKLGYVVNANLVVDQATVTITNDDVAVVVPSTPQYLDAVKPGVALVCSVSWQASAGATSYELRQGTNTIYSGPDTGFLTSDASPSYACTLSTTFTVRACNSSGCSAWSSSVTPSPAN